MRQIVSLFMIGAIVFFSPDSLAQEAKKVVDSVELHAGPNVEEAQKAISEDNTLMSFRLCTEHTIHTERLRCYDRAAVDGGMISSTEFDKITREIGRFGFWRLEVQELTSDNEKKASLILQSNQTIEGVSGFKIAPTLTVQCSAGNSEVILDWKRILTTEKRGANARSFPFLFEYHFDDMPKVSESWELSFDKKGLFSPNPIGFVKQGLKSKELVVNLTAAEGGLKTVSFTLQGLKEGTEQLSKLCYTGVKPKDEKVVVTPKINNLIYK